ncbi:MAG: universal stress protein [Calditrichia bacterium]
MFKNILCCVDSSPYASSVVETGLYFHSHFNSFLKLIHVIDIRMYEWSVSMGMDGFTSVLPSTSFQEESKKLLEERGNEVLQKAKEMLETKKAAFELIKEYGSPADIICEKARMTDLIVMGLKGEFAKWSSKFLGAVTEIVSRQCIKPILFVHQTVKPVNRILLAYDGSDHAAKAMSYAAFMGEKLKVPISLLTVHDNDVIASEIQHEAMTYLKSYDILVEEIIAGGVPEEQIIKYSNELAADLLVMGGYGHSRIREAILGSVTVQVLRKSSIPVMLIK